MFRCLKEQKYAAVCSVRAINYALLNNRTGIIICSNNNFYNHYIIIILACEKVVEIGGLKHLFPILMGRGLPKLKKKSSGSHNIEQSILSIVSQLCLNLHDCSNNDSSVRLLGKFIENGREKLERCTELYLKYRKQVLNSLPLISSSLLLLLLPLS